MGKSRLVALGKIVRAHGLQGALKVMAYGETLSMQKAGDRLLVQATEQGPGTELTVRSLRAQGKVRVMEFEELTRIEEAQEFVGQEIFIPKDRLPPASEGEYYHFQLIGLSVETLQGSRVGTLHAILETGGNDVYVVDSGGKEILIPAVEEIIREIDLEQGRMVIDPPEGLMDDL